MKKTTRKPIVLLLILILLLSLSGCKKEEPQPVENPLDKEITLHIDAKDLPVIDGALACLPYYEEMTALITGLPAEEARTYVLANNTPASFRELAEEKTSLGFLLHASSEQEAYAKENGVTFEYTPFAKDAFVFFVNKSNPVDSLTMNQLKDIYAGKVTNWKEVGGNDEPIIPYQRNEGSGSQTGLYEYVISPEEVMTPPTEIRIGDMGGIIDAVSSYDNAAGALGYSYLYFVTNQHFDEDIKLLKIDGAEPDAENIRSGIYPMVTEYCLVTRKGEATEGTYVRQIIDWCLSDQGQALAEKLFYVAIDGNASAFEPPLRPKTQEGALVTPSYVVTENLIETETVPFRDGNFEGSYIKISGLKDKTVEDKVNATIRKAAIELFESEEWPAYRGIRYMTGQLENAEHSRGGWAYDSGSFSNLLSVQIQAYDTLSDGETYCYVNRTEALTFDLRTGDVLKITDLFDDPETAIPYLNAKVLSAIDMANSDDGDYWHPDGTYDNFKLAASFPGITGDQKFILDYNGNITLLLDDETPWAEPADFSPAYLQLDTTDLVSFRKFETEESVFEEPDTVKRLLYHSFPLNRQKLEEHYEENFIEGAPSYAYSEVYYNETIPEGQLAYLGRGEEAWENLLKEAREAYGEMREAYPGRTLQASVSRYGNTDRAGDYTTVTTSSNYNVYSTEPYYEVLDDFYFQDVYVFKGESAKPLALEDIFAPGVDYKAAMKEAAKEQLRNNRADADDDWFDDYLDEMYGKDLRFGISQSSVILYTAPGEETFSEAAERYDTVSGEAWIYSNAASVLQYRYLKTVNLVLFEE